VSDPLSTSATTADDIIQLAELALRFGRTQRITFHEDGETAESDTDHTVMLSLIACSLADLYYPQLDCGLVAQYAMVHDLPEVYAGDTPTLKINDAQRASKSEREKAAVARIDAELGRNFPLIPALLHRYEKQVEPEARFVRAVDKIIPKATHILNAGATLKAQGIAKEEAIATYDQQREVVRGYASEFPEVLALREELVARMMRVIA
jgi:putative hydrolases of HD superfamily